MAKPPVNWNNVSMLTPGMKNLGNQFNERWPTRYGDSDGAVGDYAHSQGTSGHNPDDTVHDNAEWDSDSDNKSEVRAIDVDKDLNDPSCDMDDVVKHLRNLPNLEKVVRYFIFDGWIYKASNNFEPEGYYGANDHSAHIHFSGAYSDSSDANATFDFKFEEVGNMALSDADVDKIWAKTFDNPYTTEVEKTSAGGFLRFAPSLSKIQGGVNDELKDELAALKEDNATLAAKVDAVALSVAQLTELVEGHVSGLIEGQNPTR